MRNWRDKKVSVIGLGQTGRSVIDFFIKQKAIIYAYDDNEIDQKNYVESIKSNYKNITFGFIEVDKTSILQSEIVISSPGIKISHTAIDTALCHGIRVISDIQLAYDECQTPILAITGTNGKSTTTALISHILNIANFKAPFCGNIGVCIMNLIDKKNDYLVTEVSSYQLTYCDSLKPKIAIWLNLTPDHLDYHGNIENYIAAKSKLFSNLDANDVGIINYDDEIVSKVNTKANIIPFSLESHLDHCINAVYIKNNFICTRYALKNNVITNINNIKLIGRHNLQNVLAATALCVALNINPEIIEKGLSTFNALEHRLEPVGKYNNKFFYNDSKATNPDSSIVALNSFDNNNKITLIAGGKDKGSDLSELVKTIQQKVANVVLIGQAKARFKQALDSVGYKNIILAQDLKNAIDLANSTECDIVILSPACSSFDMFKNFEERGRVFKNIVQGYIDNK